MDRAKKIERLEARIRDITERIEDQKTRNHLRLTKNLAKKEQLLRTLRTVCPHEKISESGEFSGCESGMRYERRRICARCGLTIA